MNERQAMEAGYQFEGTYARSHKRDEVTAKAKELRKLGNKAITVYTPDSPLSRGGGGGGYSVYWIESEENIAKRERHNKVLTLNVLRKDRSALIAKLSETEFEIQKLEMILEG